MSKRNHSWNENKYNRFVNEGRGQGVGKEYKPWLTIQDFPSMGRVSRILGWKSGRIHHLFSDLQARYFYMLEWEDTVTDIREHFPLLDLEDTVQQKKDLDFKLFTDKESGYAYTLSTNFLITIKKANGDNLYLARSIKMASELEKKKTLERLEIERRYWTGKGIDWGIVTQKEISTVFTKNIEWVHSCLYSYVERGFTQDELIYLSNSLIERLIDTKQSIRKVTADFDKEFNYDSGTGLFVFKFLIASKQIGIDMTKQIDLNLSNSTIEVKPRITHEEARRRCL
ncbi:heteromeric transposase endonuclease subunit TnsA [Cytobacillus oceanisediminis]|uniref:Heteromeric transposase endonuclease subunit TnsA n=1 Tax=Niallia alba TaxID=2729105 RepID=A0A7Y0PK92_9BACI|nr:MULTISPECIES: TnsA endonuclease C-terminal domain-containing protein [Bacillaceae]MBZ9536523.1 heteromeric transposase endonuclease subunit TnsA [Cytobacillus oceanisediminis]NMO75692.1 heteromeric transposase endonuclease subunit TnsA [Niallia alba]UTI43489.1 TnsA endonuclease N-terminal domain-containing protein [Niallia sp. RD1]